MFSYHPDQASIGRASLYAHGWIIYRGPDEALSRAMLGWATSPSLYAGGHRTKDSFISADWLGLDFDEGPSLKEIEGTFAGQIHIIGTTKSHQIPKGRAGPCDRFRVYLKLSNTITKFADYEATVRQHVYRYDADKSCVDAARLFWPCTKVTSVCWEGETADVVSAEEKAYVSNSPVYNGRIPYWVREWLDGKFDAGRAAHKQRNFHVFKSAIWMARNGWTENAILDVVMDSKIVCLVGPAAMTKSEIKKAVKSGIERASREET